MVDLLLLWKDFMFGTSKLLAEERVQERCG